VTVNSIPVISVNSGSICNGQSFTISPSGASTYTYSGGSAVVSPTTNTNYSVSGTSSAGCVSAIAAVSNVTVNSIPVISVNSGSICNGQSFTLSPSGASTYTYSGGSAIVSPTTNTNYSVSGTSSAGCVSALAAVANVTVNSIPVISVNSGSICNGQSFTISPTGASTYTYSGGSAVVSPTTNTNYSVSGTSSAGCVSAIAAVSNVTVNSIPVISVNSGSICNGQSFTLSPSGASTYTYSGGSAVVSPSTNTIYSVSGTSSAGCASVIDAISNITVFTLPSISVNSGSICSGQSFTLSPSGASTYTYSGGSAIVSPTTSSNYSVSGTSSAGCVSASAAISSITVFALPQLTITSTNNTICAGESATLQASGANTYSWSQSSNLSSIVISPSLSSTYSLSGSNTNGCENKTTFTQSVDACVGVENYLKETSGLLVYPNPNNGEFIIETSKEITISILNVVGQVVKEVQMEQGKNQIELRNEAKGIYFIRMNDLSADRVIKIIKN
jgi:translation elongation factor EF-1alpha